jgi:hypothetical protein
MASRRLKFGMVLFPGFGPVTAALCGSFEIQGRLTGVSTEMPRQLSLRVVEKP